jgi:hypothetical protein
MNHSTWDGSTSLPNKYNFTTTDDTSPLSTDEGDRQTVHNKAHVPLFSPYRRRRPSLPPRMVHSIYHRSESCGSWYLALRCPSAGLPWPEKRSWALFCEKWWHKPWLALGADLEICSCLGCNGSPWRPPPHRSAPEWPSFLMFSVVLLT